MASSKKTLEAVLSGQSDGNIRFSALHILIRALGFSERIKGDHFIYTLSGVDEIINIQPSTGGKAKPYQVKQIRGIITKYSLGLGE